jgi:nicotinamide-nucleotide amidase
VGESAIAEKIEHWEDALPVFIKLAYLPNLGKVRLRLTAKGTDKDEIARAVEAEIQKLHGIIGDIIFGEDQNGALEEVVGKILSKKQFTVATAESCTGGAIAERITSVPGASAYFKGSVVSYATEAKIKVLQVSEKLIKTDSVVSEAVAKAMAQHVKELFNTDFAIATTGNAGPTKGDSDAEVGTVFIAIASPSGVYAEKFMMGNHRERIVQKAVNKSFELLQKEILKF